MGSSRILYVSVLKLYKLELISKSAWTIFWSFLLVLPSVVEHQKLIYFSKPPKNKILNFHFSVPITLFCFSLFHERALALFRKGMKTMKTISVVLKITKVLRSSIKHSIRVKPSRDKKCKKCVLKLFVFLTNYKNWKSDNELKFKNIMISLQNKLR